MFQAKWLWLAIAGPMIISPPSLLQARSAYRFYLVSRHGDPFFQRAYEGCKQAEAELRQDLLCFPRPADDPAGQAKVLADLVARKVDGIAVAPYDDPAVIAQLQAAAAAGIPVLTWDIDLPPGSASLRSAFVGTNDYDLGANIGKLVKMLKPSGGSICIQSNSAASAKNEDRVWGIRDALAGARSPQAPGKQLTGQGGWTELPGCPVFTTDDFATTMGKIKEILTSYGGVGAFVSASGLSGFDEASYSDFMVNYAQAIQDRNLAFVIADTFEGQEDVRKRLWNKNVLNGEVLQRPFRMGYALMYTLRDIRDGAPTPAGPLYIDVDVCRSDNLEVCSGRDAVTY
ncbi:substrate-binding domain-containing protein [Rhizobium leguminosarum]|uniref:substrate-binding domain-containing protein n=1 Tax=Rhizobium leguminosarum TaxID=384 RepID=UPI003F9CA80F